MNKIEKRLEKRLREILIEIVVEFYRIKRFESIKSLHKE